MQIVGGRWEVCLGDGSCVLFFLSFPSAFFNLYIMVQIPSLSLASPFPADPGRALGPQKQTTRPGLAPPDIHWTAFEVLKSRSVYLVSLTQLKIFYL